MDCAIIVGICFEVKRYKIILLVKCFQLKSTFSKLPWEMSHISSLANRKEPKTVEHFEIREQNAQFWEGKIGNLCGQYLFGINVHWLLP